MNVPKVDNLRFVCLACQKVVSVQVGNTEVVRTMSTVCQGCRPSTRLW